MKRETGQQHIIHFRRWSRKGYAAFSSLGRCVVIDSLKKGVVDSSLKKQPNICTLLTVRRPEMEDELEYEVTDNDRNAHLELLLLLENSLQPQSVAAKGNIIFFSLKIYGRKGVRCISPAFFVS